MLYIVDQVIIMATPMKITQQCGYLFYKQKTPLKEIKSPKENPYVSLSVISLNIE